MASFNAITLEQHAIKREKIERRHGPKPVRASLLWAQTTWLEAKVALCGAHLVFENDVRAWNFDGALLESTKRAIDKLALRSLSTIERERLGVRRDIWALWSKCASLEHVARADLRARLVLESLLDSPVTPSPARELCRLSLREQNVLLRELQGELYPVQTRELAHWITRNRAFRFWQENISFPVNIACRLGFEGDAMPQVFEKEGALSLDVADIIDVLHDHTPERTREIAQFWYDAKWHWPTVKPLCALLKPSTARQLRRDWRETEEKWRARWVELWRLIAADDLEAAKAALEFHELVASETLDSWKGNLHWGTRHVGVSEWFNERSQHAYDALKKLQGHPRAAELTGFLSELWLEYSDNQNEGFWHGVVLTSLKAAGMIGIEAARKMRSDNLLHLARRFDKQPELLEVALEWSKRGEDASWMYQLGQIPSNARNAAFMRREAGFFFSLYERFSLREIITWGGLWDDVLSGEEKHALSPHYWRLVRAMAPLCCTKMQQWHKENACNLGDWLGFLAGLFCDLGWTEGQARDFFEKMLGAIEREFKVMETAPSRLDGIESPFETFAHLSHQVGETSESLWERCESLLKWMAHGKEERTENWYDACSLSKQLGHRPHFVQALLLVSKRAPGFVREILPQVEVLQRLHLTQELDSIENDSFALDGELAEVALGFPQLEDSLGLLNEWQGRGGETSALPSGVRDLLGREEKWQQEANFLRARLEEAPNAHLQARLDNLENRLLMGSKSSEEDIAGLIENAVELAIVQSLRTLVTRALRGRLRALCGSVVDQLEWNDDWANALLLACETQRNRKWATKLLRGQSQNISGWQRLIPANQKWLGELEGQGKNREVFESDFRETIGEWELWIERDALQILQMGNRFSTCLSRGGCNSHSTIANALDANKIVVYAQRDGQIQARQLWVVTEKWALAGFHVYSTLSESARQKSGVQAAFLEFATRFAQECGLTMHAHEAADVTELCGALWYDDGVVEWDDLVSKETGDASLGSSSSSAKRTSSSGQHRNASMLTASKNFEKIYENH